jgi:hypothetical protein
MDQLSPVGSPWKLGSVRCVAPSLTVLDYPSARDMPVFLIWSIDQRADQSHAQNAKLRARVKSTASRPWTTDTAV